MHTELLKNIGLTHNQALVYEILLERGSLPASKIQRRAMIDRSLVYVLLNDLIAINLVTRDDSKKVSEFKANSPKALLKLVQNKESSSELAKSAYETVFHKLQQAFEVQSGQPGIRFYPGVEGLKSVYNLLNQARPKEILLIRSTHAETNREMMVVIKKQIQTQIKLGIKVNVISANIPQLKELIPHDLDKNTERRILSQAVFDTHAQLLIFDNTIAITTYRKPIITTVITHQDIADTLRVMFMYIWRQSLAETKEHTKKYLT